MKKELIPSPVIAVVAKMVATRETHATLNSLFLYSGAPDIKIEDSKHAKALEWLREINLQGSDPLSTLGKIIEVYMEEGVGEDQFPFDIEKTRLVNSLKQAGLYYHLGGRITKSTGVATRSLEDLIKSRDFNSVDIEFERAIENTLLKPRDAVLAASNILESICKIYIVTEGLDLPAKQDLRSIWTVVRKDLNFDPSSLEDKDLQRILTGVFSVVDGVSAIRTRASSAHGAGLKTYELQPRHARLAVHAAHTVASFVLESWDQKKFKSY